VTDHNFVRCHRDPLRKVYYDFYAGEYRVSVMRGPLSVCVYIGLPPDHPFYGKDADELGSINVHGGVSITQTGEDLLPGGLWWIGWDYAHENDKVFLPIELWHLFTNQIFHTPEMAKSDAEKAIKHIDTIAYKRGQP